MTTKKALDSTLTTDNDNRIVKPVRRMCEWLPIVAVRRNEVLYENAEITGLDELIRRLPSMKPHLFAVEGSPGFIAKLDNLFRNRQDWQYRVTNMTRETCDPDGNVISESITLAVNLFGFRKRGYHKLIDPMTMYNKALHQIWPTSDPCVEDHTISDLLDWAISLRDFCAANNLQIRPTIGSISSQFLTDPRFYPEARRKVPAFINQHVREQLPGNYYRLMVSDEEQEHTGIYIDQTAAHHYHAIHLELPNSNNLHAYGYYHDLSAICTTRIPENFYGLLCVDMRWVHAARYMWTPYPLESATVEKAFVFTNELQHLYECGWRITGIRAAWGSHTKDTGLARYAQWAIKTRAAYGNPDWLKPMLLATYGVLASRPRIVDTVFKTARKGEPWSLKTWSGTLEGIRVQTSRKLEPSTANVLHRAMIESATRLATVQLAQELHEKGFRVLHLYADAVIVQDDGSMVLPPLPEPWRVKETLHHLRFLNTQAFQSGEMTKLPGVKRPPSLRPLPPPPLTVNVEAEMELAETVASLMPL